MRIKYVIHRGKKPFAEEKEAFRKIVSFYSEQYRGLRFQDRGLRFSVQLDDIDVDFDFGYLNMRYRDFSGFHHVISQSAFSVLNPDLNPGDIVIPDQADVMRINSSCTKVRVYTDTSKFVNPMAEVYESMKEFESTIDQERLARFVSEELAPGCKVGDLTNNKVKTEAALVEANQFFRPSRFKDVDAVLKVGEERLPIKDLRTHLEGRFDGVNCEAKQMIDNIGPRLFMFGVGLDKPYAGIEPQDSGDRFGMGITKAANTYNHGQTSYFLSLFLGYCLSQGFRLQKDLAPVDQGQLVSH